MHPQTETEYFAQYQVSWSSSAGQGSLGHRFLETGGAVTLHEQSVADVGLRELPLAVGSCSYSSGS